MMIDNVMNNKDKRRTARYYERFSRYQTTKRERDFNNRWKKVIDKMKELNEAFIEEIDNDE